MGLVALRHVGSSLIGDGTPVSCIGRWILYHRATRKPPSTCSNASHWQLPCLTFYPHLSTSEVPACDPHLLLVHHFQPFQGLEETAGHTLGAPVKLLDVIWLLWCPHRSWSWNLSSTSPETEAQHCGSHSTALTVVSKVFMLGYLDSVCLFRDFQLPGKRLPKPWWTPAGSTLLQQLQALWFPYCQPWGRDL